MTAPQSSSSGTPEALRADEAMYKVWNDWHSFYTSHFRSVVGLSYADQMAFYEIAQPIMRSLAALPPQVQAGETKSAPVFSAPHNPGERLPSGDAAKAGAGTNAQAAPERGVTMLELLIRAGYDASLPHPQCFKGFSYLKLAEMMGEPHPTQGGDKGEAVAAAVNRASEFDAQDIEYARDLLGDLDDDYPDNETIVAQWFRKVRTETILAALPAPPAPLHAGEDSLKRAKDALFNIARCHGYRLNGVELNEAVRAVARALSIPSTDREAGK